MKRSLVIFGIALSLLIACKSSKNTSTSSKEVSQNETWIIADQKVPCTAGSTELCFQIKKAGSTDYMMFDKEIKGFDFQANYKYQIVVKPTKDGYQFVNELFKISTKK